MFRNTREDAGIARNSPDEVGSRMGFLGQFRGSIPSGCRGPEESARGEAGAAMDLEWALMSFAQ